MTTRVVVAPQARSDVTAILVDLEQTAGAEIAADYAARLRISLARLESFPEVGAPRPHLGRSIRCLVLSPCLVFYRFDQLGDTALILRVLHERRKTTAKQLKP
jgi:plasmid stabilization system protein ParE